MQRLSMLQILVVIAVLLQTNAINFRMQNGLALRSTNASDLKEWKAESKLIAHNRFSRSLKPANALQFIASSEVIAKWKGTLHLLLPILASAFCAAAIMYPVDLIRALQMSNAGLGLTTKELLINFKSAHGISGFFTQGLAPELARSTWMRFIKFALFPIVHLAIAKIPEKQGNEMTRAISAIIASIPEAISIMPLEISKIALQLDTANLFHNNMLTAMSHVYKTQGMKGFMVGYMGVQYRQAAWSAGYFASIRFFETHVQTLLSTHDFNKKNPKAAKVIGQVLSGFLAGVLGAALNTPGDTLRSTLQKQILINPASQATLLSVGKDIIGSKSVTALYAGFKFKAFHLGGGGALMAFLVPFFKDLFQVKE